MLGLSHQRCFNHSLREAAGRCPECRQFYCRECIIEHDGRVVCAACLKKLIKSPSNVRRGWTGVVRGLQFCFGLTVLVAFFYLLGQSLLSIPSSFHDGTIWQPDSAASE